MTQFEISEPYAPRPMAFLGLHSHDGWRIKRYSVVYGSTALGDDAFRDAEVRLLRDLPAAKGAGRPGVGFVIQHQGRGANYLVLAWWDRENELPLRVWVDAGEGWRPASGSESVCVWDLEIIWRERQAYVHHVLSKPRAPDLDAYLAANAAV
jgi:hypothetical protein